MFKLVATTVLVSSAAHRFRCNPSRMPQTAPEDTLPFEVAPENVYGPSNPENLDDFMPAESIPTPSATRYDEGIVGDPLMAEEDMNPSENVFSTPDDVPDVGGEKPCSKSYPGSSTLEENGDEFDETAALEDGTGPTAYPGNNIYGAVGAPKPCADTETADEFADAPVEGIATDEFEGEGDAPKPCADKSNDY